MCPLPSNIGTKSICCLSCIRLVFLNSRAVSSLEADDICSWVIVWVNNKILAWECQIITLRSVLNGWHVKDRPFLRKDCHASLAMTKVVDSRSSREWQWSRLAFFGRVAFDFGDDFVGPSTPPRLRSGSLRINYDQLSLVNVSPFTFATILSAILPGTSS